MKTLGSIIKEKRILEGWTQQELADRMGFKSKAAISLIEQDKRSINREQVLKFAEVFRCTPGEIIAEPAPRAVRQSKEEEKQRILAALADVLEEVSYNGEPDPLNEYMEDPDMQEIILYAGARMPSDPEARLKYKNAIKHAIDAINAML